MESKRKQKLTRKRTEVFRLWDFEGVARFDEMMQRRKENLLGW